MRAVECQEAFVGQLLVILFHALGNLLLGLGQILRGQLLLHADETLDQRLVLLKHLVVALGYGTGDDERGTGIVNQHGVHLVDDSVVVGTLHEV